MSLDHTKLPERLREVRHAHCHYISRECELLDHRYDIVSSTQIRDLSQVVHGIQYLLLHRRRIRNLRRANQHSSNQLIYFPLRIRSRSESGHCSVLLHLGSYPLFDTPLPNAVLFHSHRAVCLVPTRNGLTMESSQLGKLGIRLPVWRISTVNIPLYGTITFSDISARQQIPPDCTHHHHKTLSMEVVDKKVVGKKACEQENRQ